MTSDLLDATAVTAAADLGARASTAGVINLADGPDLLPIYSGEAPRPLR